MGKGCAQSLRGQGARVIVTEIDPINALQAAMEGYQVATLDDVVGTIDIFVTATGNAGIITVDDMAKMKHNAIVCNIGHFDNEIDMAGLARYPGIEKLTIKPQVDLWTFPDGHGDPRAGRGPAGEPGLRHRPPELRDELLVLQPGAGPGGAVHRHRPATRWACTSCPKRLDEKVAALHLDALGVKLTKLTDEQAEYLGIDPAAPTSPPTTATDGPSRELDAPGPGMRCLSHMSWPGRRG